jgi:serine/threonine-protein kinase
MAVPFDMTRLEVTGSPVGMIEGVMQDINDTVAIGDTGAAQFSVSESGSLVYLRGGIFSSNDWQMVWVDRKGGEQALPVSRWGSARISPDGKRVVFYTAGTDERVWVYEIDRGTLSPLVNEGQNYFPIWTPDGKRVVFGSAASGQVNLFWKSADGTGPAERLTTDEHTQFPSSWSPDGKTLAFFERESTTKTNINVLSLGSDPAKSQPFIQAPFYNQYPEFSPDGHWLAYVSNESGRDEVYVKPYPGPGSKQQVSIEGGIAPAWARNGRELFYTAGSTGQLEKMIVVEVTLKPTFTASKPQQLFEGRYAHMTPIRGYDVTGDGQRFLMIRYKEQSPERAVREVILVQNWFEELKRRVPTGK